MSASRRASCFDGWLANDRNRRNLADAVPFGEGPFTIGLQTFAIVRCKTGGLVSWRSTPWQAA
jgi:hypothetical protein